MHKTFLRWLIVVSLLFFFIAAGVPNAFGQRGRDRGSRGRPPWARDRERPRDPPPVSAPEPTTLSLIGMAIAGGAGYYYIKRKKKK
jgi:LPXTG-motif cell wall-anchored protein